MMRWISLTLLMTLAVSNAAAGGQQRSLARSRDYWYAYAAKLPIGSTVNVRTSDGRRQTAILAVVDEDGITLEPKTRIPEPPRRVSFDELEQLELKQNGSSVAKAIGIGVAAGAATFFGILLIFAATAFD